LNGVRQPIHVQPHPLPPNPCYSSTSREQPGAGGTADQYYDKRVDQGDVPFDERPANRDFGVGRLPIPGWAPEQDIGDIGVHRSIEPDRGQHPVEQLAGGADEGPADPILLGPRCLADEHDPGPGDAVGENSVGRRPPQRATVETGNGQAQLVQRAGRHRRRAGSGDGGGRRVRSERRRRGGGSRRSLGGRRGDGWRRGPPAAGFLGETVVRRVPDCVVGTGPEIPGQQGFQYGHAIHSNHPAGFGQSFRPRADRPGARPLETEINTPRGRRCKACDIKDPQRTINWVVPGGGGANYPKM
jgi:hypothetical protein